MASSNKNLNNFFLKNKFLGSYESTVSIPELVVKKECCFIGRSNVGKSSLINAITKTKKLAKTSKTPGRTQSINIFEICLLYTSPSPRDRQKSRMPSSA